MSATVPTTVPADLGTDGAAVMRTLYRLVRRMNVSLDLQPTLDAVVSGVVEDLGFEVAAVNLVRPDGDLEVVAVAGSDEAGDSLRGAVGERAAWDKLIATAFPVGTLRFVDHRDAASDVPVPAWTPSLAAAPDPDGWHSEDMLFVPLMSVREGLLGVLSVDLPVGGRRPGHRQLELLEMFGAQAQLAIENARLLAAVEAGRRADNHLLTDRMRSLVDSAPCGILELDLRGRVVLWNPAAEQLFGWSAGEALGVRPPAVPPVLLPELLGLVQQVASGEFPDRQEQQWLRRDGKELMVELSLAPTCDSVGAVTGVLAVVTDVTGRLALQRGLQSRLRQQEAVVDLGRLALTGDSLEALFTAAVRTVAVTLAVPGACLMQRDGQGFLMRAAHQPPGTPAPPTRLEFSDSPGQETFRTGRPVVANDIAALSPEVAARLGAMGVGSYATFAVASGDEPWGVLIVASDRPGAFRADDLTFLQAVAQVLSTSIGRARAYAQIRHQAQHDALTGLSNRQLLADRMTLALQAATRAGHSCALLLLDLDGFKDVNDSQGHSAGDEVLRQVAARLLTRVRSSDTVARLGGDEFAVCLSWLTSSDVAHSVAAEIGGLFDIPFDSDVGPVRLSASIGIAIAPEHGEEAGLLLQRADLAMYRAKRERTGVAVYDPGMDEDLVGRLALVADLRAAIAAGELTLAYQPVVDLGTRSVRAVEALVRWTHPERGPLPPTSFVPLAEQNGLIQALTEWVVDSAVAQAVRWRDLGVEMSVAVNLSGVVLGVPGSTDHIDAALAGAGLSPHLLAVEVTETALVDQPAVAALRRLSERGIAVAVDDFGTGYAGLGYLKQLPAATLKIDRSFITRMSEDPRDVAIVRAVVALAHEIGLTVVAEGVETEAVVTLLTRLGVDRAQGYLFSRPLPAAAFGSWLARWTGGAIADTTLAVTN